MFSSFRHLIGWILSTFGARKDLLLENLALRQQLLALRTKRRAADYRPAQAVLGPLKEAVVRMAETADPGEPTNGSGLAPCWLSAVLEMALQSRTSWWPQACR